MSEIELATRDFTPAQTAHFQRNLLAGYAREDPDAVGLTDDDDFTAGVNTSMQFQPDHNTIVRGTKPTVSLSSLGDHSFPAELECQVCNDNVADTRFRHCHHKPCLDCATIVLNGHAGRKACPFCRVQIAGLIAIPLSS